MCPFCVVGGPLSGPGKEKITLRFASAIASEDPGPSTAGAKNEAFDLKIQIHLGGLTIVT